MESNFMKWFILCVAVVLLSSCTLATVRTIEEDQAAKEGFNADRYVASIWESDFLPALDDNAVDITQLLEELDQDEDSTIEKYGNRTSTGPYSFMVTADVQVVDVNRESRVGLAGLDILPADGEVDIYLAIGPVLRGNALRDAVGFIAFNDFTNQVEFAQVSDALKSRIDADILQKTTVDDLVGENVRILGAFTFDDRDEIVIMPVRLEVLSE